MYGVGLVLRATGHGIGREVSSLKPESSATARQQIRQGDNLIEIDGKQVAGSSPLGMLGAEGTSVELKFQRGAETFSVRLQRTIQVHQSRSLDRARSDSKLMRVISNSYGPKPKCAPG
eukprot:CAMPEP_0196730416 /NCGR_PEP_ID=MMETSP1091-20130531/10475_1 /TAXON_ID=302021 /ORGANISM="Rhodomonas sp., Strain CCMP768" /LENGTH=117 /DNA_ID=CAMNT_0042073411 /DNA_START=15 /DNA_END=365 /DNA_ORIENTATION=+